MSPLIKQIGLFDSLSSTGNLILLALTLSAAILPAWILLDYARVLRLRRRMPPGPFPLPLVGNFFDIPKVKPWHKFEEWSKQYKNPLITLWNGGRPIIVCNDCWTISDLLEKRANIYSGRPHMVVMGDMINGTKNNQVALGYDDSWRTHRRLTHAVVGSQAVRSHRSFQGNETKVLLKDLLETPNDYVMAIERYSCSVVSIIGWGRRIEKMNDYVAQTALSFMEVVDMVVPGVYLMEAVPWLAKLPPWIYPLPTIIRQSSLHLQRYFYALSKEGAEAPQTNFAQRLLAEQQKIGLRDAEIASLTANLIGGGVDTTSSSMISFILAMCVFPEAQKKAQEEIDLVVGQDRMPDWDDSLPYCAAIAEEVLRWRTVTILGGIPHAPIQDDEYRGYFIPKGTSITGNVWAIHRHPRDFPEPDVFRPERFLDQKQPYPNKKGHNAFGWGRRQCSGQPLAEQGLGIVVARMLWAFNIQPGLDEKGQEVKLDIFAYTPSENMRPEPFKARFIPRSPQIVDTIRHSAEVAKRELAVYDSESKLTLADV